MRASGFGRAARRAARCAAGLSGLAPSLVLAHAATSNTVLFDREIVRILEAHCVMCHATVGPSPPLETYEEAWLARRAIHDRTLARQMPPWAAVPGYGEFKNANRLTLREQRFVVSWVEGLGPRNAGIVFLNVLDPQGARREEVRARPDFDRWVLGAPDREVELPPSRPVPSGGEPQRTRIQRSMIDLGLDGPVSLAGLEFRPRARDSIRAAVFTVEQTGQWLATWTPWHGYRQLSSGTAYRLDAGATVVAEIHTTDALEPIAEPGTLGLHLASEAAPAALRDVVLTASADVPAGVARERLRAETMLASAARVHALWPDLPADIDTVEVSAVFPSGHVEVLLFALETPAEWPTAYIYETPVALPAGARVSLTAYATNADSASERTAVELRISLVDGE